MDIASSDEATARPKAMPADAERAGASVDADDDAGQVQAPARGTSGKRAFGLLPGIVVPEDFDAPLPAEELVGWRAGAPGHPRGSDDEHLAQSPQAGYS